MQITIRRVICDRCVCFFFFEWDFTKMAVMRIFPSRLVYILFFVFCRGRNKDYRNTAKCTALLFRYFIRFAHSVIYLTACPQPLSKGVLHTGRRSSPSSLNFLFLSFPQGHILPCLPITSILASIFPSITRFRRQFLRLMWPIQLGFRLCYCMQEIPVLPYFM